MSQHPKDNQDENPATTQQQTSEQLQEHLNRPRDKYAELTKIRGLRTWLSIAGDLLSITILLMLTYYFPKPWLIVICGFFIARQQYAMAILGHDAVHSRLFSSRPFNRFMGRLLFNGPTMISWDGYKRTHLQHHYHTMNDEDPDKKFVEQFPLPIRKFLTQYIPDLLGLTWLYLFLFYGWHGYKEHKKRVLPAAASMLPGLLFNAMLFGLYWWLNAPWLYLFCWLLPMLLILPVYMHIRGICEHALMDHHKNQMLSSRTVVNPIQTYFIAPHNLNYHMEHHAYPGIPQYNLPALHNQLREKKDLPLKNLYGSYLPILKQLIKGKTAKTPEPAEQS